MRHSRRLLPMRAVAPAAIALATVLSVTTVTIASAQEDDSAAPLAEVCDAFGTIEQGKYFLNNNLWGQDAGTGWQCVHDSPPAQDGTIAWGTNWEWSGEENSVKSYVSSVLGWHWSEIDADTGLPVQLSSGTPVNTVWDYDVSENPGTMNVAYDLWLHTIDNPGSSDDPTDEIMIWPYRSGGAGPIGETVATVDIAGATWELHQGNIGWEVYSFVRVDPTESVEFNLMDFLTYLTQERGLDANKYLTSVQAGTEVFHGAGSLETSRYATDVG